MEIRVPFYTNFQALTHVQHKHFFAYGTLDLITEKSSTKYTDKLWRYVERKMLFHRGTTAKKLKVDLFLPFRKFTEFLANKFPSLYQESFLVYFYPASEMIYKLTPIK